ncbi:MAG TPA: HAMP domain-containing sensor histidine kinase [Bacteroidia bacterium]|nr:HAMP domain-containing sensor histidine kinase [Bacteroidia bacterium]
MRKNAIRLVVMLGTISVIGIILVQIYWVRKAFDLKEKQFDQTIQIALRNVGERLAAYGQFYLPRQNVIEEVSPDYYAVNINNPIDKKALEYYLTSELESAGIKTDFEYAVYDCTSDKMVYGNYISSGKAVKDKTPKNLTKLDKFTYYFGIYFPERSSYIVSQMDNWILTSGILVIVIFFFGYALFIILQQKRLSEIQKDFINNMTHEFKTPISTIAISSYTISDPEIIKTPDRLFTYAGIIKEEAERLNRQVEIVLQTATAEKHEFKLNKESIDLHELIKTTAQIFNLPIQSQHGEIVFKLNAEKHTVSADKQHLTNLILNLLDNAVKYSGQSPPVITISTFNEGNKLILSFMDKGQGIKKEYQKKVFDKFFRVPSGNVHNVKGFGLGLSYVKSIVHMHKWKIGLESEPNKGSTFTLEIPL